MIPQLFFVSYLAVTLAGTPFILIRLGYVSAHAARVVGSPMPFLVMVAGTCLMGAYQLGALLMGGALSVTSWWMYSHDGPRMEELARREGRRR